jgi:hypothetical protein
MTENEFALSVIPILLGGLIPDKTVSFAEVPKTAFNDHADLLIIRVHQKDMMFVEFKLSDAKGLEKQVDTAKYQTGINTIGIINKSYTRIDEDWKNKVFSIAEYSDGEIDFLIAEIEKDRRWTSIYHSQHAMMLYYGYMRDKTNYEDCGKKMANRMMGAELFKKAIVNLCIECNSELNEDIPYGLFGLYNSISTARKYYRQAVKEYRSLKETPCP